MSDTTEKSAELLRSTTKRFVNKQQKQFYAIRIGFMLAKIAAAAALALLIIVRFWA